MHSDPSNRRTVPIAVTVTEFQPIGERQGCSRARFRLGNSKDAEVVTVREDRDSGDIIEVKAKAEVDLEFHLEPDVFLPIGMSFRETAIHGARTAAASAGSPVHTDPLGTAAFPARHLVAVDRTTVLTVHDANPVPAGFEFDLVIQRRTDGRISRIDPKILNTGRL